MKLLRYENFSLAVIFFLMFEGVISGKIVYIAISITILLLFGWLEWTQDPKGKMYVSFRGTAATLEGKTGLVILMTIFTIALWMKIIKY